MNTPIQIINVGPSPSAEEALLTRKQVSVMLQTSGETIRRWVRYGQLRELSFGERTKRYRLGDVMALAEKRSADLGRRRDGLEGAGLATVSTATATRGKSTSESGSADAEGQTGNS